MKPIRLCSTVLAALLIAVPAASAARATVRVMTATADLIGPVPELSGAARSYVDDTGTVQVLPADTVMGQLVAVAAVHDLAVGVHVSSFGGYVTGIGGVTPDPTAGFWELFVNDAAATAGADQTTIHRGDEVVWVLDPDFTRPGPSFLDLNLVTRRRRRAVLHVTRVDETGAVPGAGAHLRVAGRRYVADARGNIVIRVAGRFRTRAWLAGSISSQRITVPGA